MSPIASNTEATTISRLDLRLEKWRQFPLSYRRAARLQASATVLGSFAALIAWIPGAALPWTVSAALLFSVVPVSSVRITFVLTVFMSHGAGPVCAQKPVGPAAQTRAPEGEGFSFTLPPEWEWENREGANISGQKRIMVGERPDLLFAKMSCNEGRFVGLRVQGFQTEVKEHPADYAEIRIQHDEARLGVGGGVLVSYVYTDPQLEPRRPRRVQLFLVRRFGFLYEWVETSPLDADAQPATAFTPVRSAITWGRPKPERVLESERNFINQSVKFRLPEDWSWVRGKEGAKVLVEAPEYSSVTLFEAGRDLISKEGHGFLSVSLQALKSSMTIDQFVEFNKERWMDDVKDAKEFEIEDSTFRAQRALSVSHSGQSMQGNDPTRYRYRSLVVRHRTYVLMWTEIAPTAVERLAAKPFEVARKGLVLH